MSVLLQSHPSGGGKPAQTRRAVVVTAAVDLVIAVPVAAWWLIGDQSSVPAGADPDYMVRPLGIAPGAERAAGLGSLLLAVVAMPVLAWATRRRLLDWRWWIVLVQLLAAGFTIAAGWRVMTAGVIGANIGGGLMFIFGGPVVAALLGGALASSVALVKRGRAGPG